jgi:hypothetical protein
MAIDIAIFVVAVVPVVFAASRVMSRKPPPVVEPIAPLPLRRRPAHHALPPVTIDTLPPAGLVPPIDRNVLAALAEGGRGAAHVSVPVPFARGSIPPGYDDVANDLDDDAETLRAGSDLDEDAVTRANMSPVA